MNHISKEEAEEIATDFLRDFPVVFQRIALRFRRNAQELYGKEHSQVEATMKAGYSPKRGVTLWGSEYDGRVDFLLDNTKDRADLLKTLRHEILGHHGINTFTTVEKSALLHSIIESKNEPTIKGAWEYVENRYSDKPVYKQAEEVFARIFETVQVASLLELDSSFGPEAFLETSIECTKPMQLSDLLYIASMITQGLHDGSRTQQHFPQDYDLTYADRVNNISALRNSEGVAYTFWKHASTAVNKAGDPAKVNWRNIESITIIESVGTHGQNPVDVAHVLCEISPGSVKIEQQLELRNKILRLTPQLEAQYAKKQKKANERSLER